MIWLPPTCHASSQDWEVVKPPKAPRACNKGLGAQRPKTKKRSTKKYRSTKKGMQQMLGATLGDTTRARRVLLYSTLQPAVKSGDDAIEPTQRYVLHEAERMGARAMVITYCGGPQDQENEKRINGFGYR